MDWRVKAIAQGVLARTPGGKWINDRLQRKAGALRNFEANVDGKISDFASTIRYLREANLAIQDATIVEIGTGWFPVLPVCFALSGAGRIITYDLVRHLNEAWTLQMVHLLESRLGTVAKAVGVPVGEIAARFESFKNCGDLDALLRQTRIEYHAPADAGQTGLPGLSADLVYSNSVLEHVRQDVVSSLFREAYRILRPGGAMVHNIGCNDHYAFFDRSVSFVNYYRFSDKQWRFWNNDLLYQNRLRPVDFLDAAMAEGFEIAVEHRSVRPGVREALETVPLASKFREYSLDDLVSTSLDFVSIKPVGRSLSESQQCVASK